MPCIAFHEGPQGTHPQLARAGGSLSGVAPITPPAPSAALWSSLSSLSALHRMEQHASDYSPLRNNCRELTITIIWLISVRHCSKPHRASSLHCGDCLKLIVKGHWVRFSTPGALSYIRCPWNILQILYFFPILCRLRPIPRSFVTLSSICFDGQTAVSK